MRKTMRKILGCLSAFTMLFTLTLGVLKVRAEDGGGNMNAVQGQREEICLNGVWECQDMPFDEDVSALPEIFNNTIPVPGLWDLAEKPFSYTKDRETLKGNYDEVALWYKKAITFESAV
ncbi:MAG: hypothetical protein IKZ28_06085, partial [Clostridia bacterium]|nr:hypothetical protein [Clostridia bacterium]